VFRRYRVGVTDLMWDDENRAEDELPQPYKDFLAALRPRVRDWPFVPWASLPLDVPDEPGVQVMVCLDISDREAPMSLMSIGVYFDGRRLRGDHLHNQSFELPDVPTPDAISAEEQPEELAARAADWFEELLRRPLVRREWRRRGRIVARRWEEETTGRPLVYGGRRSRWAKEHVVRLPRWT
jgi:hypothetical protein